MGKKQRIWITAMMHWEKMHEFCNHRKNIALEIILSIKKTFLKLIKESVFQKISYALFLRNYFTVYVHEIHVL